MNRLYPYGAGTLMLATACFLNLGWFINPQKGVHLTNFLSVAAASFATFSVFMVIRQFPPEDNSSMPWKLLAAGFFLYALGETAWLLYESILGWTIPYPSWADLYWLSGYLPLLAGTWVAYWQFTVPLKAREYIILHAIFIGIFSVVVYFLLWPIAVSNISFLQKFLSLAYPVLDGWLVLTSIFIIFIFGKGLLSRPWSGIATSFLMFGAADTWFSYLTFTGQYYSSHPVNIIWVAAYVVAGLSAFEFYNIVQKQEVITP